MTARDDRVAAYAPVECPDGPGRGPTHGEGRFGAPLFLSRCATLPGVLREMFDGPFSQKVFAGLWLATLLACFYGLADVIYIYVTTKP